MTIIPKLRNNSPAPQPQTVDPDLHVPKKLDALEEDRHIFLHMVMPPPGSARIPMSRVLYSTIDASFAARVADTLQQDWDDAEPSYVLRSIKGSARGIIVLNTFLTEHAAYVNGTISPRNGIRPKQCIKGMVFSSLKAFSRHIGLTPSVITDSLSACIRSHVDATECPAATFRGVTVAYLDDYERARNAAKAYREQNPLPSLEQLKAMAPSPELPGADVREAMPEDLELTAVPDSDDPPLPVSQILPCGQEEPNQ